MKSIMPSIGRIVWFWDYGAPHTARHAQPEAAMVTYVHGERMVNLSVFSANGEARGVTSVELCQPGDSRPGAGGFCEWMPYQIAQAEKHEAEGATVNPNA